MLHGFKRFVQVPVERFDPLLVPAKDRREEADRECDEEKEGDTEQKVDRFDYRDGKAGKEVDRRIPRPRQGRCDSRNRRNAGR